ncbi:hypothetical protein RRG08_035027 [Elysia crispata]|uniref:Secreted protein n=1 Tax=Elysia crispata TaxID=231223 RepID=A0AAE1DM90_9GAST|nr:hypothetical protein RRG08_035027 [Elysia crispata]
MKVFGEKKGLVLWTLLGLALVMLNLPEVASGRECDASNCASCRPYRGHARCRCVVAYCGSGRRRRGADFDLENLERLQSLLHRQKRNSAESTQ